MAIISSKTLVLHRVTWLTICAFFLIKNPYVLYSNIIVVLLGSGLDLDQVYLEDGKLAGLVAALLLLLAAEDFVALFTEHPQEHFRGIVPVRLIIYFALTFAAYFKIGPLANALAFTYAFLELILNLVLYISVRDELNEATRKHIHGSREGTHATPLNPQYQ